MSIVHQFRRGRRGEAGQTLVLYVIMALALVLVVAMCVDGGTIYLTKAELDKAADAAVLTAIRNLYQGQTQASTLAQAAFTANYRGGGPATNAPAASITFATDSNNNTTVSILATATFNTYFMRIIPRFQTFQVSSAATATRAKLIMSVVLDHSGSMQNNGGSTALPSAVNTFISYFDDTMDQVSLVSFASTTNLNVSVRRPFKSAITSAVNAMTFGGATYADGGLQLALQQNNSVPVAPGDNTIKVVVLFTDGYANTFQGTWPVNKTFNVGGFDPPATYYAILDPRTGNQLPNSSSLYTGPAPSYCPTMVNFVSVDGTTKRVTPVNCTAEGQLRALATAAAIRGTNMYVFCIGLGNALDQSLLQQAANDPAASTYNPNQPVGEAAFASNASQLQTVFQQIASKILLRLTK